MKNETRISSAPVFYMLALVFIAIALSLKVGFVWGGLFLLICGVVIDSPEKRKEES